ncbi:hypothetical protein BEN30_11270 [Magnetovibrio blakemorei]|uniref:Uncharacterized protein n=1 Tax=Magnetovibrio blakemorei TaxID=28181 RepID=A0A1E5Q767_9PROT|nr:hypothetical protein BEN30_11270 [Magnetovibrio blakemorei]
MQKPAALLSSGFLVIGANYLPKKLAPAAPIAPAVAAAPATDPPEVEAEQVVMICTAVAPTPVETVAAAEPSAAARYEVMATVGISMAALDTAQLQICAV